jgi:pimeloyl-ACP methyl ester carboxylesterase
MKSAAVRRVGFRDAASHADRITAEQSLDTLDDIAGCTVEVDDFLGSSEQIAPLNPVPCPITIAWSGNDAIIKVPHCDKIANERVPQASFTTLPGVGHDPMIDNPALVAQTILTVTGGDRR